MGFKVWIPDNLETCTLFMEKYFKPYHVLTYKQKKNGKEQEEGEVGGGLKNEKITYQPGPKGAASFTPPAP